MTACRITVLKRMFNQDLAETYRRPDIKTMPCKFFQEGQEFVVEDLGHRPANFACDWAWNDIQKAWMSIQLGGDFGRWMRNPDTFIVCCTDGIKPVVFKLERFGGAAAGA